VSALKWPHFTSEGILIARKVIIADLQAVPSEPECIVKAGNLQNPSLERKIVVLLGLQILMVEAVAAASSWLLRRETDISVTLCTEAMCIPWSKVRDKYRVGSLWSLWNPFGVYLSDEFWPIIVPLA
jgi:hypothetical protein